MTKRRAALAAGALVAAASPLPAQSIDVRDNRAAWVQSSGGATPARPPAPDPRELGPYRPDQPAVMAPPRRAADPTPDMRLDFAQAYRAHGRPRMMLFWERSFSDSLGTQYEDRSRTEGSVRQAETTRSSSFETPWSSSSRSDQRQSGSFRTDSTSGTYRVDNDRRAGLAETTDWKVETAFTDALAALGVTLIDRQTAMRMAGRAQTGNTPNGQAIEATALLDKADLLLEVLPSPDAAAPTGMVFRINVKEGATGRVIGSVVTRGVPPPPPAAWVAGPGGFVRAQPPVPGPAAVGQRLADETMGMLLSRWR